MYTNATRASLIDESSLHSPFSGFPHSTVLSTKYQCDLNSLFNILVLNTPTCMGYNAISRPDEQKGLSIFRTVV